MLDSFPPEILAQILFGECSSYLVFHLIKCGDASLTRKLLRYVEYIDLKDSRRVSRSRYPKLLSGFPNLRYLSIDRPTIFLGNDPIELLAEFEKLPLSKLETLKLTTHDWFPALMVFSANIPDEGFNIHLRLMERFSALTTLSLGVSRLPCKAKILRSLPPTLTCLSGSTLEISTPSEPIFSSLPRSLEVLDTLVSVLVEPSAALYESPPPNLHTIESIYCLQSKVTNLIWLPRTLKRCSLKSSFTITIESLRSLPPQLELTKSISLQYSQIGAGGSVWSAGISAKIRTLELSKAAPNDAIDDSQVLPYLPSSLTSLSLVPILIWVYNVVWDFTVVKNWPKDLTALTIMPATISSSTLTALPSTIKQLTIGPWTLEKFGGDQLPNALTRLELHLNCFSELDFTSDLPSTLKRLTIKSKALDLPLSNLRLPEGLLYLKTNCLLTPKVFPSPSSQIQLPSTLQTLRLSFWHFSHFGELPRSLTELEVVELSLPTELSDAQDGRDAFADLPSGLQFIKLRGLLPVELTWSRDTFSSLKHPKRLNLNHLGKLDPEAHRLLISQGCYVCIAE